MTLETVTQISMQAVLSDAIQKGHTNPAELSAYMMSETFTKSVLSYRSIFIEVWGVEITN